MQETHPSENQPEIIRFWQNQGKLLRGIYDHGAQKWFQGLQDLEKAFDQTDKTLRCIDEGTPGGVHAAGSGILLGMEKTLRMAERARVQKVTSHAECGAAALYAKEKDLPMDQAEKYAREWAELLGHKLGVPVEHLDIKNMLRPGGLHIARAAYYDSTGRFDYSRLPGLPTGFTIDRKHLAPEDAKKDAGIAISIATGPHGYGNLISSDPRSRFVLIAIGDPLGSTSVQTLEAELIEVVQKTGTEGRVMTDGFMPQL